MDCPEEVNNCKYGVSACEEFVAVVQTVVAHYSQLYDVILSCSDYRKTESIWLRGLIYSQLQFKASSKEVVN